MRNVGLPVLLGIVACTAKEATRPDECPAGQQGCSCYANNSCDDALLCLTNVCSRMTGDEHGDPAGGDAAGGDGGAGDDPLGLCPDSTLVHYSLTPLEDLPSVSDLELPDLPAFASVVSAGDGAANSMRLDVCRDGSGNSTLRAVLFLDFAFGVPYLYIRDESLEVPVEEVTELSLGTVVQIRLPPANFIVEGLAQTLGGMLDSLWVRLVHDSGMIVVGHPGFVAAGRGRVGVTTIEYTVSDVVVGGLEFGDVFASRACSFGQQPLASSFTMATADFEVEACTFMSAGHTTGYQIHRLAVQDSSTQLTPAERQRFEFVGEQEVESVLNYAWNHHNACDSFHLALDHADYAATAAPSAGCGPTVPNAPERSYDDPESGVLYRIRYHGGAWTDGAIDGCNHYLFCN
ncbi:hypothetical protein ACFL6C_05790 [Myxococcota bacterium]